MLYFWYADTSLNIPFIHSFVKPSVYDLLADRRTVKIRAHEDDVNSCCWADTASGNVLVSASDDTFLKVWDRRSLGSSQKPSGVLIGHTEGITYVSAKGDGRYVISNGKDQVLRLWDLRKMRSSLEHEQAERHSYGIPNFDYRYVCITHFRRAAPQIMSTPPGADSIQGQNTKLIHWIVASCNILVMRSCVPLFVVTSVQRRQPVNSTLPLVPHTDEFM